MNKDGYWFNPNMCIGIFHSVKDKDISSGAFCRLVKRELAWASTDDEIRFVLEIAAKYFPQYKDRIEKLMVLI